jgi:hypothetical protein
MTTRETTPDGTTWVGNTWIQPHDVWQWGCADCPPEAAYAHGITDTAAEAELELENHRQQHHHEDA